MTFEAPLFIPSGKEKRDIGTTVIYIMFGLIFVNGIFSAIFKPSAGLENVLNGFLVFSCVVLIVLILSNLVRIRPLNGEIKGTLKIDNTKIVFGERVIQFDDIVDFDFDRYADLNLMDYYSSMIYGTNRFEPALSQGVQNEIHLKTKEGESITINFRLENKEHGQELKPFVRMLALRNKMPLIRAISLLKLDYKAIQELKAEIAKGEPTGDSSLRSG